MKFKTQKNMNCKYRLRSGFLFTDMLFGLLILGIVIGCFAITLNQFARFNHFQLVTQRCLAAGQGQLDSLTISGKEIKNEDFQRLWQGIESKIMKTEGKGQWQGLELVTVTTKGRAFGKDVKIELSRYVIPRERK